MNKYLGLLLLVSNIGQYRVWQVGYFKWDGYHSSYWETKKEIIAFVAFFQNSRGNHLFCAYDAAVKWAHIFMYPSRYTFDTESSLLKSSRAYRINFETKHHIHGIIILQITLRNTRYFLWATLWMLVQTEVNTPLLWRLVHTEVNTPLPTN